MIHIEFLVEELSAEVVLQAILPKILGAQATFEIHIYQGKPDLMSKLESRLRGYRKWIPENYRIVVLIDEDRKDCHEQKQQLENAAKKAGFITKSSRKPGQKFQVLNRLAIEEIEAWFFGDSEAIARAYPKLSKLSKKAKYKDPDAIRGGTWESLERELQRAGYHGGGMPKILTAREIAAHMDPDRNRSGSFKVFREGLLAMMR